MSADARAAGVALPVRPSGDGVRSPGALVVAWQHPVRRLISPVGLLERGSAVVPYRFRYLRGARDVPGFQPFLSFPDWAGDYRSANLFPMFSQRIMSPRRPDYPAYLGQLLLDGSASPWEQLARSEGRRHGDTVRLFPVPTIGADGASSYPFFVHGIRHVNAGPLPALAIGDRLALRADPGNPINPAAELVCTEQGEALGYVPDLLLEHLGALRSAGGTVLRVEHVNGPDTPPHLRLLARLNGTAPAGYLPMSGPRWALATGD